MGGLVLLAALLRGAARCLAQTGTTFTASTASHTTTTSSTVDQRQSTGLIHNIVNGGDQVRIGGTARLSLSDPRVQSAYQAALKFLNAQLPAFPQGATLLLLSRTLGSGGTSSTITQNLGSTQTVTVEHTIGPATIIIGNRDAGGTAFEVQQLGQNF